MTDVLQLIEAGIAVLAVVVPIVIAKIKDDKLIYAISIIQNFMDLLKTAGITMKEIAAGTVTDKQKIKLADALIAFITLIHFDKTISATVPVDENTVDTAVNVIEAASKFVKE